MRKSQVIVLHVEWETEDDMRGFSNPDAPAQWDWSELSGDNCTVIASGNVSEVNCE